MTIRGLVVECGNHHMGDVHKAKEMVLMARDAGATYAKFQAIGKEKPPSGTMPEGFYRRCALHPLEYLEIQEYGDEVGLPVFFSFFDDATRLVVREDITKIAGHQFRTWALADLQQYNDDSTIVSISDRLTDGEVLSRKAVVQEMNIMSVGRYNEEPNLSRIAALTKIFGKQVGYSCHKQGTDAVQRAVRVWGARLVEAHFNPYGPQEFDGVLYRDCRHAKDQKEIAQLARLMESVK
jgi:sialic acid synthase SpsE